MAHQYWAGTTRERTVWGRTLERLLRKPGRGLEIYLLARLMNRTYMGLYYHVWGDCYPTVGLCRKIAKAANFTEQETQELINAQKQLERPESLAKRTKFGQALTEMLEERDLTHNDLYALIGESYQISPRVTGTVEPEEAFIKLIAYALELDNREIRKLYWAASDV